MTDWNADDAPVKLGGGERRDQLTARSMTNRNAAMQLQIEWGIFFILIARNPLKSPDSKK
jgi:hypothetical protein